MKQYVVDAFTKEVFQGNPAAICVLDHWLPEDLMCKITAENRYSETAFAVREGGGDAYHLRWFTPGGEIDLCGHATLCMAYVLSRFYEKDSKVFHFTTKSGPLTVRVDGDKLSMDFPAYDLKQVPVTDAMAEAIGVRPVEAWMGRDLVCVLPKEEDVRHATVDQEKVKALDGLLLHITARGKDYDMVSRSFAPKLCVAEDPVCGSGHCHLVPLWAKKLGKNKLTAFQASERTGVLYCTLQGDRVEMAGYAALYSIGDLVFPIK
jgi:PhzF family phenazine biosynthesis protein